MESAFSLFTSVLNEGLNMEICQDQIQNCNENDNIPPITNENFTEFSLQFEVLHSTEITNCSNTNNPPQAQLQSLPEPVQNSPSQTINEPQSQSRHVLEQKHQDILSSLENIPKVSAPKQNCLPEAQSQALKNLNKSNVLFSSSSLLESAPKKLRYVPSTLAKEPPKTSPQPPPVINRFWTQFPDAPFPEFEQIYTDACHHLFKGNHSDALENARILNKKLKESNGYETRAYLKTIELITRILCLQKKYEACLEFLLHVTSASSKILGPRSSACLTSRMLLAHLRTNMGKFQEALEDHELILNSMELVGNSSTSYLTLSDVQLIEVYHAKAALLLVLGRYDDSFKMYDKIVAELERMKMFELEQVTLVAAKVALVSLKSKNLGRANRICEDIFRTGKKNKAIFKNCNIYGISGFVKQRWVEIESALSRKQYVPNPPRDFLNELDERGVNIFVGLQPKEWKILFG